MHQKFKKRTSKLTGSKEEAGVAIAPPSFPRKLAELNICTNVQTRQQPRSPKCSSFALN